MCSWQTRSCKAKAKRAAYILPHSASSTLWAVYKLIMQATHCPPPAGWVLILPTSEGSKAESTLSWLPGTEPQVVRTILAAVQQFNHCATRLYIRQDTLFRYNTVQQHLVTVAYCNPVHTQKPLWVGTLG